MGLIGNGLMFIAGVLLLISLIAGNLFLTMSMSLDYNNIKDKLITDVKNSQQGNNKINEVTNNFNYAMISCQNNSEYDFNSEKIGYTLIIPCEIVLQGQEATINYASEKFVNDFYYKEYDCGFWKCAGSSTTVFVSETAKDYWTQKFYLSLLVSAVLTLIVFFLLEKKKSIFFDLSVLIIISALPLLGINWIISSFNFADVLFLKAINVFRIMLILGIALILVGIILKFWGFFGGDEKFSRKEVEEIVREEVSKSKGKK